MSTETTTNMISYIVFAGRTRHQYKMLKKRVTASCKEIAAQLAAARNPNKWVMVRPAKSTNTKLENYGRSNL